MTSEKQRILDWFVRCEFKPGVFTFDDLLVTASAESTGKSLSDAEAFAQQNAPKYWNWLKKQMDEDSRKGLRPIFSIHDNLSRRIGFYGSAVQVPSRERRRTELCKSRASLLKKMDALTDREYEALGCVVSRLAGAENVFLTAKGNEKGIDFFAAMPFPSRNHVFLGNKRPVRIVGQSKKWSDRVKGERIRDFITTIEWVKNRNPLVEALIPSWFRTSPGPILGWMISHKGFQAGSEIPARDFGIFLSESRDLAEIAALSRSLAGYANAGERANQLHLQVVTTLGEFA